MSGGFLDSLWRVSGGFLEDWKKVLGFKNLGEEKKTGAKKLKIKLFTKAKLSLFLICLDIKSWQY